MHILFITKMLNKNYISLQKNKRMLEEPRMGPHTTQKGKIMKVQVLKELTLSILWVGTLSILVFLHSGIQEEFV